MMRFPANVSFFVVPAVCLLLLGAAWAIMRGGGETEVTESPGFRLICEESLKLPVTGIIAAYERRGGVTVEVDFVPSSGLVDHLEGGSRHDLLLLAAGNPVAGELARQRLLIATEERNPKTAPGVLQSYRLNRGESPDLASNFVEFLSGPYALGILERFKVSSEATQP